MEDAGGGGEDVTMKDVQMDEGDSEIHEVNEMYPLFEPESSPDYEEYPEYAPDEDIDVRFEEDSFASTKSVEVEGAIWLNMIKNARLGYLSDIQNAKDRVGIKEFFPGVFDDEFDGLSSQEWQNARDETAFMNDFM